VHRYLKRAQTYTRDLGQIVRNKDGARPRLLRQYAFDAMATVTPTVEGREGELRYMVRTNDKWIGRGMFGRAFELEHMAHAIDLVAAAKGAGFLANRVFVDVGANIGNTSLPALRNWEAARVVAIEAEPENFKLLRCNAILNGLDDRLTAVHAAVTDTPGSVELELSPNNFGDHRVRVSDQPGVLREQTRTTVAVPAQRLDDLLEEQGVAPGDIGLLWLDTQGHEGQVLHSAPRLLAHGVPVVTEFWPYGLRRSEGLDLFRAAVLDHIDTIVDVRLDTELPATAIDDLIAAYDAVSYTDLVLLPGA
jgi:FkbM family methyltransferase